MLYEALVVFESDKVKNHPCDLVVFGDNSRLLCALLAGGKRLFLGNVRDVHLAKVVRLVGVAVGVTRIFKVVLVLGALGLCIDLDFLGLALKNFADRAF